MPLVTPQRQCNCLHCSSLFHLSAYAWQFDCLSFPQISTHNISTLCFSLSPSLFLLLPLSQSFCSLFIKKMVFFEGSCWKFSLKDYIAGAAAVVLVTFWCGSRFVLEGARCHKPLFSPSVFLLFLFPFLFVSFICFPNTFREEIESLVRFLSLFFIAINYLAGGGCLTC